MPTTTIANDSFFHRRMQAFVANTLFPAGAGDWYKNKGYGKKTNTTSYDDFIFQQKNDPNAHYYQQFKHLNLSLTFVTSQLANTKPCSLEVLTCALDSTNNRKPGKGKHIVYFPGANTYYQACFRDIARAAKETGATVHAFNFPGTGLSSGKVSEANDLTNAGLSVVTALIKQGVHPDNIILQGDCYGAAVALEVKEQLEKQAGIKVRLIMNNAFKSFKAVVCDMITESPWLPNGLKSIVKQLLEFTGWHITPGKKYKHASPYQCHIQHLDDQTLTSSTLSSKVSKYKHEAETHTTQSKKRAPMEDTCPAAYLDSRNELDKTHYVKVKEDAKARLATKFGVNKFGKVNSHFADLCELEMLDGKSAYEGYVNEYLKRSNEYIQQHPQKNLNRIKIDLEKVRFLSKATSVAISKTQAEQLNQVISLIHDDNHPQAVFSLRN